MFYKDERLALFIDGSNIYNTAKALGFEIDYKLLRNEFMKRGKLLRMHYYTAVPDGDDYSPMRPLIDYLSYNGFTVVEKTFREYSDGQGRSKIKGNLEVELTVDAMALGDKVDHMVLFSGNGDYLPLVQHLKRQGVRVTVASSIKCTPSMVADELRRQADNFIDIDDLREIIARPPRDVPQERPLARSA